MLILALESSAKAASVALCRDGVLIAQSQQCSGLTHSCTLLPMAEQMLKNTDTRLADVDAIAVARGPGSFTGVRIGVSTAKGLAWGAQKPAIGVSTLEAMAYHGLAAGEGALVCAAMDARRSQIYNALFEIRGGKPVRLCEDRAISLAELGEELGKMQKSAFLVGDGAQLCYNTCLDMGIPGRAGAGQSGQPERVGGGHGRLRADAGPGGGTAPGLSAPVTGRAGTSGAARGPGGTGMKN